MATNNQRRSVQADLRSDHRRPDDRAQTAGRRRNLSVDESMSDLTFALSKLDGSSSVTQPALRGDGKRGVVRIVPAAPGTARKRARAFSESDSQLILSDPHGQEPLRPLTIYEETMQEADHKNDARLQLEKGFPDTKQDTHVDLSDDPKDDHQEPAGTGESSQYTGIGLQDLVKLEREVVHPPPEAKQTVAEVAEPVLSEMERVYAGEWVDVVSEKEDELVETANALGQIVDVESMAVADTLCTLMKRVAKVNQEIGRSILTEMEAAVRSMMTLAEDQKRLMTKLNENQQRDQRRSEQFREDLQSIQETAQKAISAANNKYVDAANALENRIDKFQSSKNLQTDFNMFLAKSMNIQEKCGSGAHKVTRAAGGGGRKRAARGK